MTTILDTKDLSQHDKLVRLDKRLEETRKNNFFHCRQTDKAKAALKAILSDTHHFVGKIRQQRFVEWKTSIRKEWKSGAVAQLVQDHLSEIQAEETPEWIRFLYMREYGSFDNFDKHEFILLQPYHVDSDLFPVRAKFIGAVIDLYPEAGQLLRESMKTKSFANPPFALIQQDTVEIVSKPRFAHAVFKMNKFRFVYVVGPKADVDNSISTSGDLVKYKDLDAYDEEEIRAAVHARFDELKRQREFHREVRLLSDGFVYKPNPSVSLEEVVKIFFP